jgi:hypothetical protein
MSVRSFVLFSQCLPLIGLLDTLKHFKNELKFYYYYYYYYYFTIITMLQARR